MTTEQNAAPAENTPTDTTTAPEVNTEAQTGSSAPDNSGGDANPSLPESNKGPNEEGFQDLYKEDEAPKADEGEAKTNEFVIPDEFKDKPWAQRIKTQEDLWKKIEHMNDLVGKKHIAPDLDTASEAEVNEYFQALRPETAEAYEFKTSEDYEETGLEPMFAKLLHDANTPKVVADAIIKGYQEFEKASWEKALDAESFTEMMQESFGPKYKQEVTDTRRFIEENLTADQKILLEKVPNNNLKLFYELANQIKTTYAGGETGKGGEYNPGKAAPVDYDTKISELRQQVMNLDKGPHDAGKRQTLINEMAELTKQKMNSK